MKVYQLVANGPLKSFGGTGTLRSGQIFLNKPDQAAQDRFAAACGEGPFTTQLDIESDLFKVAISEVELVFNGVGPSTADTAEDIALAFGGEDMEGLIESIEDYSLNQVIATRLEMQQRVKEYFDGYDFGPATESIQKFLNNLSA